MSFDPYFAHIWREEGPSFQPIQYKRRAVQLNPFTSGILYFFPDPRTGLFSVKIQKKFLAIKNFSVNDTMYGQPNKRPHTVEQTEFRRGIKDNGL